MAITMPIALRLLRLQVLANMVSVRTKFEHRFSRDRSSDNLSRRGPRS